MDESPRSQLINHRIITVLISRTARIFVELHDLSLQLDPERTGAQEDARARIREARKHLDRAIGSLEEAQQQLEPTVTATDESWPTAAEVMEREG